MLNCRHTLQIAAFCIHQGLEQNVTYRALFQSPVNYCILFNSDFTDAFLVLPVLHKPKHSNELRLVVCNIINNLHLYHLDLHVQIPVIDDVH